MRYLALILMALPFIAFGYWFVSYEPVTLSDPKKVVSQPIPVPSPLVINENDVWNTVNKWRSSTGKKTYIKDPLLCQLAEVRLDETQIDWSHAGAQKMFDKNEFFKSGKFSSAGENLGRYFYNPDELLDSWLASPTHRKNLDNDFTHGCIKCENNYCVHLFAK